MKTVYDYLDRKVTFSYPPKRIISFVPTITSTLYHLQLTNEIIGRTRFCIYPEAKVAQATIVGGTKDMKLQRIAELEPDLIIMEKEENTREMVATLEKTYPVYVFEVQHIEDALQMITDLGEITDRKRAAQNLRREIEKAFGTLPQMTPTKKAAYVIWQNPYMVVGKNTYIQSLLERLGFHNPFVDYPGRYPIISEPIWQKEALDYIFLASEPYPFQEKHIATFQAFQPNAQIYLIDGEMFWYGERMLTAANYLTNFINKLS